MKKLLLSFGILVSAIAGASAQNNVGINTTTPNASAALDVTSTTQGLLPPRMTMAQRNAIASPVDGLIVYQTDNTPGLYLRNGGVWGPVGGASAASGPTTELFATINAAQTKAPVGYVRYSVYFNNIVTQLNSPGYNSSTNTYTVPAGKSGTYLLNVSLVLNSTYLSFFAAPEIQVTNTGGTVIYYGAGTGNQLYQGTDTDPVTPSYTGGAPYSVGRGSCTATVPLQAGDVISVYYRSFNSTSSSQTISFNTSGSSFFSIVKLN